MEYPKITQEQFNSALDIVENSLKSANYLKDSTYSNQFREVIQGRIIALKPELGVTAEAEYLQELPINHDDQEQADQFRSIQNLEFAIDGIKVLSKKEDGGNVKLNAYLKLIDLEKEKISLLERLFGITRVAKIEALTKQFFRELKNNPDLKALATRYLEIIETL